MSSRSLTALSSLPFYASHPTWPTLLRARAGIDGAKVAFTFLLSGEEPSHTLTYAELDQRAQVIATALRSCCVPGDRALLLYPAGLDFITAFFGCLHAGVVAVPAYPPRANDSIHRLQAIVTDAGATVALTTRRLRASSTQLTPANLGAEALTFLTTDDLPASLAPGRAEPVDITPDTLALLQYTSGSRGKPKGVMLSHRHLLANEDMIRRIYRHHANDVIAGWLPLFHDMGLIGIAMQTLYVGATCLLMPPTAFLQKPLRWLQLVSRHRVTTTGAPNFAYDLCVRRITEAERATLDLSSLRIAFNGSEPIHAATLETFARTFAPCGFRREAFLPCYGMAESALLISGKTLGRSLVVERFDPGQLAAGTAVASTDPAARTLVSSGRAARNTRIVVVDPSTRKPQPEGTVGEIWVRSPSVGAGYWNQPDLTKAIFHARLAGSPRLRFLRTGDLGFLDKGEPLRHRSQQGSDHHPRPQSLPAGSRGDRSVRGPHAPAARHRRLCDRRKRRRRGRHRAGSRTRGAAPARCSGRFARDPCRTCA